MSGDRVPLARADDHRSAFRCTFIVPCKGRLAFLRQTIGSTVSQPHSRVIVVDYACPDRSGDWVETHYPQCEVVRVHEEPFNLARARNLGARAVKADDGGWLCFLDADVQLAPDFHERMSRLARGGIFLVSRRGHPGLRGLLLVTTADFARSPAYDERYSGYGREASDMRLALFFGGLTYEFLAEGIVTHLPHEDGLRMRFYAEKDLKASLRLNTGRLREKITAWERSTGLTAPPELCHPISIGDGWPSQFLHGVVPKTVRSWLRKRAARV